MTARKDNLKVTIFVTSRNLLDAERLAVVRFYEKYGADYILDTITGAKDLGTVRVQVDIEVDYKVDYTLAGKEHKGTRRAKLPISEKAVYDVATGEARILFAFYMNAISRKAAGR